MRRNKTLSACPSDQETIWGFTYLAFQLLCLPSLLRLANEGLGLSEAELNFAFFLINFLAIFCIFHDFLGRSARQAAQHPIYLCQAVVLGLAAYFTCRFCMNRVIGLMVPGFKNYNDSAIAALAGSSRFLTVLGTVVLVPPVEECLYRGLIFRNLYGKSRAAAYILSILAFSCIHILGYLGRYSWVEVCMAVLQYLPAGLCLAWTYAKADTVFAPVFVHAIVNVIGIYRTSF